MNNQIAKQFDKVTLAKIGKGVLISATGAATLYLLNWIGTLNVGIFTPLVASGVPILVNIVREWYKGS